MFYDLGKQAALQRVKLAAPNTMLSMNRGKTPTWGLGGQTPPGFASQPVQPGGPGQLNAAPVATPPSGPGPSPSMPAPMANPAVQTTMASGITPAAQPKDFPGAGTAASLGAAGANPNAGAGAGAGAGTGTSTSKR